MKLEKPYTTEELIQNQSFIALVLDQASDEERLTWKTYESHFPDDQESIEEARQVVLSIKSTLDRQVTDQDVHQVFDQIKRHIESRVKSRKIWKMTWVRAVAACFVLAVAAYFLTKSTDTTIRTANATWEKISLPDGSTVNLNASSELRFKKSSYNQSHRILKLKGQAFFKVVNGKPFVVETEQGRVTVLGTSFDVFQRDGEMIVGCKTGKVKVEDENENFEIIEAGEEIYMAEGKMNKLKASLDKIGCWENGTFYYKSINLRRILDEVERQFNTKIVCQPAGIGDQLYSGYFINTHLDSALMSICWPLRIQYEHQESGVVVSRK